MTSISSPAPAGLRAELAALGPYFAVDIHQPGSPLCPPWQPLSELISTPDTLAARIGEVRERLAAAAGCPASGIEFRVAASIAQLGLCARLLSPALGAAAVGRALRVDTAQARWVPSLGGPFRLSLPDTALPDTALPDTALPDTALEDTALEDTALEDTALEDTALEDTALEDIPRHTAGVGTASCLRLLAGPIGQVVRAVESMAVSPQVLWGNVASAVNGAATMIAAARPDLAAPAASAAAAVLQHPALAGSYQGRPGEGFRRRNCCLIYRIGLPAAASYCGDCILGQQAANRAH